MTTFRYQGMDNSGGDLRGFLEAGSDEEVQTKLKEQGVFVTKIGPFARETISEIWEASSQNHQLVCNLSTSLCCRRKPGEGLAS